MPTRPALDTVAVIGGSVAGLLAAAAVAPHAGRVVVLDRDDLPAGPAIRPNTPHARHSHGLLASGRASIERLLPGFTDRVIADGGISSGDLGRAGRWWIGGGLIGDCELGVRGLGASRLEFEHVIRERVRELPAVEIRDGADVRGLRGDGGRITGVEAVVAGGRDLAIEADLVVDASGRAGRASRWLPRIGAVPPVEERIPVGLRSVTTHVPARPDDLAGRSFLIVAATPAIPRGGVALRQEDGSWTITLFGYADQPVPDDPDGLESFAAGLVTPDIATLLRDRSTRHPAWSYRFPDCRRRRFRSAPAGYVAIGDAVCSIDPTFGQGMSLAALQAIALRTALDRTGSVTGYPAAAERIADQAWRLVAGAVGALPGVVAEPPGRAGRMLGRYVRRVQRVARHDPAVAAALIRVTALLEPPPSLLAPAVLARVLRPGAGRGSEDRPDDPAVRAQRGAVDGSGPGAADEGHHVGDLVRVDQPGQQRG
jgi:2-polyprenyl-6-methoxyphenol hydroxylase-like FAD-dependent oxidoreductase